MPNALAFRYARALADVVTKPGAAVEPQAMVRDLEAFAQALAGSPALHTALESPAVPPARKRAVVSRLARALAISDLARRFLLVLMDHRRTTLLPEVVEAFEAVVDERLGVVRVDVVSARELAQEQRDELVAEFSRMTGKQARARFSTREDLIGGVLARVGSTVFDGSVRGQLDALKHHLAGTGD